MEESSPSLFLSHDDSKKGRRIPLVESSQPKARRVDHPDGFVGLASHLIAPVIVVFPTFQHAMSVSSCCDSFFFSLVHNESSFPPLLASPCKLGTQFVQVIQWTGPSPTNYVLQVAPTPTITALGKFWAMSSNCRIAADFLRGQIFQFWRGLLWCAKFLNNSWTIWGDNKYGIPTRTQTPIVGEKRENFHQLGRPPAPLW